MANQEAHTDKEHYALAKVEVRKMNLSPVQEFYRGKCVLITGVTGFCGKVLLEKLLRSCPGIGNIYVLIRPKKNQDARQRLEMLLEEALFNRVRLSAKGVENLLSKVIPLSGDITKPTLGLLPEDRELITSQVSIVFHVAATIKFNENLKLALQTNTIGTLQLINICKQISKLKAFVHVSTAYAHCYMFQSNECLYPVSENVQQLMECINWLDEQEFEIIESKLIGKWPNTYCYSKALAEQVVAETETDFPLAIVRPSMVTSCWKEPLVGWTDNANGPTSIVIHSALGRFHAGLVSLEKTLDIIPVDIVTNSMILISWEIANIPRSNNIRVYHVISGTGNPITWDGFLGRVRDEVTNFPTKRAMYYMCGFLTTKWQIYVMLSVLLELMPAILIDIVYYFQERKFKMIRFWFKSIRMLNMICHFGLHEWTFEDSNMKRLCENLKDKDREIFNCDVATVNWDSYIRDYVSGIRTYIFKEDEGSLNTCRKRYKRLYILHCAVKTLSVCLCAWMFLCIIWNFLA